VSILTGGADILECLAAWPEVENKIRRVPQSLDLLQVVSTSRHHAWTRVMLLDIHVYAQMLLHTLSLCLEKVTPTHSTIKMSNLNKFE